MRSSLLAATAVLFGCCATAALGAPPSAEAIATKAKCSLCHSATKKVVGPAYHDIAAKYHGNAAAPAQLAAKVRSGGKGVWGPIPMAPLDASKISDADLATVIGWILAQ